MKRSENNRPGIYKIHNKVTGKGYIGSAVNLTVRFQSHRKMLYAGKHHSPKLQHSWDKYGKENFEFFVLEYVENKEYLIMREQHWINYFDASKCGYNICPTAGSMLGIKASEETRKKLSAAKKGIKFSEEHKKNLSESLVGREFSDDTRQKMSLAKKNRSEEHNTRCMEIMRQANIGRITSDEQKRKLSIANKGRVVPQAVKDKMKAAWIYRREKPISEETRKKISLAGMGRKHSEETKKKMSLSAKGQKKPPVSAETRKRMSESRMGKKQSKEWIENSAASRRGLKRSPEIREKMRQAWIVRRLKMKEIA